MPRFNEKEFEAEQDMQTLKRADEVKADKKRMKAATDMAKKEVKGLQSVARKAPRGGGKARSRKK